MFSLEVAQPSFGKPPIFLTKKLDPCIKSSRSLFGHIAFGSNLPSFQTICKKNKESQTLSPDILEVFYLTKEIESVSSDVPDVLSAVGLGKLNYGSPKRYGSEKDIKSGLNKPKFKIEIEKEPSKATVTLTEIDFFTNCDERFGKIDWN